MANRYWVGGSGTWNTTSTTNWSASSGGASGASVPTAADSVFFDQAGTYTVTLTGALTCLDFTVSAGTVTFSSTGTPTISGSMSLIAGTVWSSTGAITFNATTTGKTVTTNGVAFNQCALIFNGVGGVWTLGSALSFAGQSVTVTNGTFDTGGYALTGSVIASSNSNVRTINLNNSTYTSSGTTPFNFTTATNLTFNAGTSQVTCTYVSPTFNGGGKTFYNVAFTSTSVGTRAITGANTFNNLDVTAPSTAGVTTVTFAANQTINGTLSTTGTAGNRRVFFASSTYGIGWNLTVNSAPSLTDADFRDIYVLGTAAPISGTRIGNCGNCTGITFSTPKTVYWNLTGSQSWSSNGWASTSGGTPSTDNFPLPQDTAVIDNNGAGTGISLFSSTFPYVSTVDLSARTNAFSVSTSSTVTCYGNWTNGSGISFINSGGITFSGGGTQTITSAGKTFSGPITVDTYGGTVQLADALNISSNTLTVTNGTFDTQGYAVTADALSSSNSNVRTIKLNASTISLASFFPWSTATKTNLTFDAGTSTINCTSSIPSITGGLTFYNFAFTSSSVGGSGTGFFGANTYNNLTIASRTAVGIGDIQIGANQTINGTLTINSAGSGATSRIFFRSDTIGTQRTLTVNSLSAADTDFRDIVIAGTAAGTSPTRAGDCGNNSGITFPAPKTVYWNLAGSQNWSATGWATSSGGAPAINNFPLAQDTAVFDNTGSAGTVTIDTTWNIGTFDASGRSSAMTLTTSTNSPVVYGDWKFGTGVTSSNTTGTITFSKNGTSTITSNGVQFGCLVTINNPNAYVQLADALSLNLARTLRLTAGTFDAVTYNVTTGLFANSSISNTLKMGSGTWTLSGTGTVWSQSTSAIQIAGTSTIVLSDTSTTARTFAGGGLYYNKLTIGGTTGISTLTITGANTFGELASTKTVAHTIVFPSSTTTTIGKWSVTGTSGNVVTLSPSTAATTYTISIAGPANTGINYLFISYCAVSTTSPGEFYVGVNSISGAGNTSVTFAATPSPRTLYWVGGNGSWSSTTKWSTSSGGPSGAAIPSSLDSVVFDSASSATAYTALIDTGLGIARCASFTMSGPASGNVTFSGTTPIAFHGNVTFAATGITRSYTGAMNLAGNSSYTFTTNGLAFASATTINGIGSTWTLGSALNTSSNTFTVSFGTFDTSSVNNYSVSVGTFQSSNTNVRAINLNASTLTASSTSPFLTSTTTNLTLSTGTSTITSSSTAPTFAGGGQTFYNVSFTSASASSIAFSGANTFNNLTFIGRTTVGIIAVTFSANQTINGTLTLGAGTAAAYRTFLASDTIGTTRTLTVNALAAGAADIDFRDITIAGAAAPISGTRFGDCKGNSGITFDAAKTVYYRNTSTSNWGTNGIGSWSLTSGGAFDATAFPLAQDTAVFPASTYPASGSTTTINANYNIGTIDMSLRTSNTMTLATSTNTPTIYGNWINGTGVTLSGTSVITFAGRGSQTITNAGKTFTQPIVVNTPSGSVTLQDSITIDSSNSPNLTLTSGTFDANGYGVTTISVSSGAGFSSANSNIRTLNIGSGTWYLGCSGTAWTTATSTNLTITGTGTISLTNASAKTFAGGGANYSGITLNQGGAGTLTISGNNTFANITNTYGATGATTISLANTTQTVGAFTAAGTSGKLLTITGTSAASPATIVYSGASPLSGVGYLNVNFIRAYPTTSTWVLGSTSNNGGSLGFSFVSSGGTVYNVTISESSAASESMLAYALFLASLSETTTAADTVEAAQTSIASVSVSETTTATDSVISLAEFYSAVVEQANASDTTAAVQAFGSALSEQANASDTTAAARIFGSALSEQANASDTTAAAQTFGSALSEQANASDTTAARPVFTTSVGEQANASGTTAASQVFDALILETPAGGVDEFTGGYPLGTSFSGSSLFGASSASGGVTVVADGTGTGSSGGFAAGGNYVIFTGNNPRALTSLSLNLSAISRVVIDVIAGSSTNGGEAPDAGEDLVFEYSTNGGGSFTVIDTLIRGGTATPNNRTGFLVWTSVSTTLPVGAQTAATILRWRQTASTSSYFDAYGIRVFEVIGGGSGGAAATESVISLVDFYAVANEQANASDATAAAQGFTTSVGEQANASDTTAARPVFTTSVGEQANALDTAATRTVFTTSVGEQANASETNAAAQIFESSLRDQASASDATATQQVFTTSVSNSVNASDAAAASQVITTSVSNSVTATTVLRRAKVVSVFSEDFIGTATEVYDPSTSVTSEIIGMNVVDISSNLIYAVVLPSDITT